MNLDVRGVSLNELLRDAPAFAIPHVPSYFDELLMFSGSHNPLGLLR